MDNLKSYEFTFLYLINKCILLFKYIDIKEQQNILYDIKLFINKLHEIFSNHNYKNNEDKKNKILEILIEYFEKIIDDKIYNLLIGDKNAIIIEIEQKALYICEQNEINKKINKAVSIQPPIQQSVPQPAQNIEKKINTNLNNTKEIIKNTLLNNLNHSNDFIEFEKKINNKVKSIFNEIENNIKNTLKDYLNHTESIENDYDKKFNEKLSSNNIFIENKVKELLCNDTLKDSLYEYINNLIKFQITDIYSYIDTYVDKYVDRYIENYVNRTNNYSSENIDHKIVLLTNIFNENIRNAFNNLNLNDLKIIFDKEQNEMQLYYNNNLINSTKINIKGLIGPKGPEGKQGNKGDTPIIKKINVTDNNKLKIIIQDNTNIYEVISEDNLPCGPKGDEGKQGEPGKTYLDLSWNQDNIMRIDKEVNNSLIFLKSLCVGEKSHCLKENSLSIAGAKCFNNNSFAIGSESKTLDSESIAFFGTCIGKKAFSYRADNVDENSVQFGMKNKTNYNTSSFNIVSKEINLDCDILKIKTNNYENSKIKELEDKIIFLEKKIAEINKKIN